MNEIIQAFSHMTFVEQTHQYYSNISKAYLFTTTRLLGLYMPKFREKYWLAHGAAKRRFVGSEITSDVSKNVQPDFIRIDGKEFYYETIAKGLHKEVEALKKEWKDESTFGKDKGVYTHNHIDVLTRNKSISVNDYPKNVQPYIRAAEIYYEEKKPIPFITEFVIGDDEFGLGGMPDMLDQDFILNDYKTDKTITKTNVFAKMLYPLNRFPASSLNKHFFQLNIYEYIIEKHTSLRIKGKQIINFTALCKNCKGHGNRTGCCADCGCPELEPVYNIFDVPALRADTILLLNHYKDKKDEREQQKIQSKRS